LFDLDRLAGAGNKARCGLAVLKGFIGAIRIKVGEIDISVDIEQASGTADSGDLEVDLPSLFAADAEAAEERDTAVAILIDEIQYFAATESSALIIAMHEVQQRQLPLVLIGAACPFCRSWPENRCHTPSGCSAFRMSGRWRGRIARRPRTSPAAATAPPRDRIGVTHVTRRETSILMRWIRYADRVTT
jgi:hypothetical protein